MALYRLSNPAAMASQTMGQAAQTTGSMQKKTERRRDDSLLRDIQAGVGIAQGIAGLADTSWKMYDKYQERDALEKVNEAFASGGEQGVDEFLKNNTGYHINKAGEAHKEARQAEAMRAHDALKRENEAFKIKREQEDLEADDLVAQWRQERGGKDWLDGRQITPAILRAAGRDAERQLGFDKKRAQINLNNSLARKADRSGSGYRSTMPSDKDMSILAQYSTTENELGDKVVDYAKVNFLDTYVRKSGLTSYAAIAAYEGNVEAAMKAAEQQGKKISRADAERAVQAAMAQKFGGSGQIPSVGKGEPQVQSPQQPGNATFEGRIDKALTKKPDGAAASSGNGPSPNAGPSFWDDPLILKGKEVVKGLFHNPMKHPSFSGIQYVNPELDR